MASLETIRRELSIGRLKGGRYFSLFMYPPPRGDYFVIYDEDHNEVHRFMVYLPIATVISITHDEKAPTFVMQRLSEFNSVANYLGLEL